MEKPKNWPDSVAYITSNVYSKKLDAGQLAQIVDPSCKPVKQKPSKNVRIKKVLDAKHPAFGQYGLYADRKLAPKEHVIDYLGYVHPDAESDPESNYDLLLDKHTGIGVEATRMGCEARMINDYRGIMDKPNVKFDEIRVNGELRMAVFVLNNSIAKGQELCVNYGKGFWAHHQN